MEKMANNYDEKLVLDQLKYLGMLDIIRIRKEGYPVHLTFHDFIARYRCIYKNRRSLPKDDKEACKFLISHQKLPHKEYQIGKTKVFLRSVVHEPLEDLRNRIIIGNATRIQKIWRGFIVRRGT